MKSIRLAGLALLGCLGLTACNPSARDVGKGEYDPARLGYFRDARTGFCFAVSSYSRVDTGGKVSEGLSHAAVPCTPQVEALLRAR